MNECEIRAHLEACRRSNLRMRRALPDGSPYTWTDDFVLRHGAFCRAQPLPRGYRHGAVKQCFGNAFKLTLRSQGLRYVEGYAVPVESAVLLHHAWCVDRDDRVIDVTWRRVGIGYFGVVFSLDVVARSIASGGNGVLDDWPNGWPILHQPFKARTTG